MNPERGGRITSLRLREHELLDLGIGVEDPTAGGFVAAGAWGWDEMVPTLDAADYPGPGPWAGTPLPDHGEAWRLPWVVSEEARDSGSMECSGHVLPWQLRRRIELTPNAVRLTYAYSNQGAQPLYAYWRIRFFDSRPGWRSASKEETGSASCLRGPVSSASSGVDRSIVFAWPGSPAQQWRCRGMRR